MNTMPLCMSVEQVRHEMMRGILVPRDLVNRAFVKVAEKLEAKETKFFAHQGVVVSERKVDSHDIQMRAADQIFSMAGLYVRERDTDIGMPKVQLEIDAQTGVMRLIVGSNPQPHAHPTPQAELPAASHNQLDLDFSPSALPAPLTKREKMRRILYDEEVED